MTKRFSAWGLWQDEVEACGKGRKRIGGNVGNNFGAKNRGAENWACMAVRKLGGNDEIFSGELGMTRNGKLEVKQRRSDLLLAAAQWLEKEHGQGRLLDAMGLCWAAIGQSREHFR